MTKKASGSGKNLLLVNCTQCMVGGTAPGWPGIGRYAASCLELEGVADEVYEKILAVQQASHGVKPTLDINR